MASRKNIKKDIRFVIEQVISDALDIGVALEDEKEKQKVLDTIIGLVDLHNELLSRVNNPDGKENPKLVKQFFNKIYDDLLEKSNAAYDELNKLAK
jgi:hypothetical protein